MTSALPSGVRSLCGVALLAAALSIALTTAMLLRAEAAALAAQSSVPVMKVQTDLQTIAVRVTDKQGNDVRGLTADDFTVLEDHRPQKISFFGTGTISTSLVILLQSSRSMDPNSKLGTAEGIAARFIGSVRVDEEVWAMDFTDEFGPFQQLTQEQLRNPTSVKLDSGISDGSSLYDAIAMALCHLGTSKNLHQAIVVVTDGVDQHSRVSLDQLIALVRSSRAQLFVMGWHIKPEYHLEGHPEKKVTLVTGHDIDNPTVVFDRLSKEAGAQLMFPTSEEGLELALKRVSDLLESEYTLAYYPQGDLKRLRRIEVRAKLPGVILDFRHVVGSNQAAGESVHFSGTCAVSPDFHSYPYESKVTRSSKGMTYHEDFSDSGSGWPVHEDSRYTTGGYELSNPSFSSERTNDETIDLQLPVSQEQQVSRFRSMKREVIAAYGPWWQDFRASVVVVSTAMPMTRMPTPSSNSPSFDQDPLAAGLVFRMTGDGYYAALLSREPGDKKLSVELVKKQYRNHSETVIVPWFRVDLPKRAEQGIRLSVEGARDQFTLYVNDQRVAGAQDHGYPGGYVGFVLMGVGRAIFRDLDVEQVP